MPNAGSFWTGMAGSGQSWSYEFTAPNGVNWQTANTIAISSRFGDVTVTNWSIVSRTPTVLTARYVPLGTELTRKSMRVTHTVTVDGVPYRYEPVIEQVREY